MRDELDGSRSKEALVPYPHNSFDLRLTLTKLLRRQFGLLLFLGVWGFVAKLSQDVIDESLPVLLGDASSRIYVGRKFDMLPNSVRCDILIDHNKGKFRAKLKSSFLEVRRSVRIFMERDSSNITASQRYVRWRR